MAHDPEVRAQAMRDHVAIDRAESEGEMTDHVAIDHVAIDHVAIDHVATDHVATDHVAIDRAESEGEMTDHAEREDAKSSRKSMSTPLQGEMQFLKP
jgi:hypothetical protein